MFYSRNKGELLEPIIRTYMEEVAVAANIHVYTVHLRTERDLLWKRIQERLVFEPHRLALNEQSEEWMDRTLSFYDTMRWDTTVRNEETTVNDLSYSLLRQIASLDKYTLDAVTQTAKLFQLSGLDNLTLAPAIINPPTINIVNELVNKFNKVMDTNNDSLNISNADDDDDVPSNILLNTPHPNRNGNNNPVNSVSSTSSTSALEPTHMQATPSITAPSSFNLNSPLPMMSLDIPSRLTSSNTDTNTNTTKPTLLLSLDGNIGAGKTTLLKALELACPELVVVKEPVEQWMKMCDNNGQNILELFYKDPKRYSYTFQHTTLMTRISNTREALATAQPGAVIVSERSILTDRNVFATMLRDQGHLNDLEWDLYTRWYGLLADATPIDGVIYLTTEPDTCADRIKRRGRPGEVIEDAYLVDLHNAHKKWVNTGDINSLHITFADNQPIESLVPMIREYIARLRQEKIDYLNSSFQSPITSPTTIQTPISMKYSP